MKIKNKIKIKSKNKFLGFSLDLDLDHNLNLPFTRKRNCKKYESTLLKARLYFHHIH